MKTIILLICFVTLFSFSGDAARACTCVPSNEVEVVEGFSVKKWLKEFDGAMFTGHVTKIERVMVDMDEDFSIPELKVTFAVERYWKGIENGEAMIYTGVDGAACGVRFVEGEKYFVIAQKLRGRLHTDICSSPEKYEDVEAYIKELGKGRKPKGQRRRMLFQQ